MTAILGLNELLTAPGPSGQEDLAARAWRDAARGFGEVSGDVLGSSWVRVPGTADGPLLAVVGHIDEIALLVSHVSEKGFLHVVQSGGWDAQVLVSQRVEILTRDGVLPGVIGVRKQKTRRGEDPKPYEFSDLFVDIGARDRDEAKQLVRPGDAAIITGAPLELRNGRVASRSLDNRLGCFVALEVARRVAERGGSPGDVIAAAAVQEEVGDYAGSRTVAFATEPDVALAIDVTNPSDIRGADHDDEGKIVLGGGPTLSRGPSIHPDVFELLHDTAEAEGIPFAVEVSRGTTWTDADALYVSRSGVATGVVSVPLRYMHSPVETIDLEDVERAVQLIVAFAFKLEPGLSFAG